MNSGALTDRERRLYRLPYIVELPYEDKKEATKLIVRGIDETLLHFWYNVRTGCYDNFHSAVLKKDIERMQTTYPQFDRDIIHWTQHLNPLLP